MTVRVSVQRISRQPAPDRHRLARWARQALSGRLGEAALTIRIVDDPESAALNARWRGKQGPTNVLSFPAGAMPESHRDFLGDLVIAAPLVAREAARRRQPAEAHWAHLVVHGTLHLLGLDHQETAAAEQMEAIEREILARLGYPDPYQES